ncbi:MAG: tyrosine-type recombinase/integrase, partial [Chloroflexi bacterium]|nr:tyrosine-type recombinase/integrase [Chloroflexota bacterium]
MAGYARALASRGYAARTVEDQVRLVAELDRWMVSEELSAAQLTPERLKQFVQTKRRAGHQRLSHRRFTSLLGYMRELEPVPESIEPAAANAVEILIARYRSYLERERGLAPATVSNYVMQARAFLRERADRQQGTDLETMTAAEVTHFVVRQTRRRSPGAVKMLIPALRSLLRFLYVDGITHLPLAAAVLAPPNWNASSLPRPLEPHHVAALLASCDRRRIGGRRDYAILKLLVRLGLRASEVIALELGDVDWRRGEILIRGKAKRLERLPLPSDVGEALGEYLVCTRRPDVRCRAVFLSVIAPITPLTRFGVKDVVYHACKRAKLPRIGPHRLRHTAASQMLRSGSSLTEIAQVLRHRSLLTTAVYAKI